MIHKSFEAVIDALESAPPWSVKVVRMSDSSTCMVLDFTGTFLFGSLESNDKGSFFENYVKLTTILISAENWYVYATDCKWKE